ncbi:MAG TPA: hypothetical protein VGP80_09120 [Gemmatimonadales bacterium]|jgi:hypothetical protein|nr:hypothetical protein [Gemmatimonadales bacterium]
MSRPALALVALLVCPAARVTAQTAPRFSPGALNLGRDSFTVIVQGRTVGFQRTNLKRTPSGFEYTEDTGIGTAVTQSTVVSLNPDLSVRTVAQHGKVQGKDAYINIAYAGRRVHGNALVAAPQSKEFAIDTVVTPGTIDDNAIQPLLATLPWAPRAAWKLTIFSAGKNASAPGTLTVVDTATVQVPAGTFKTWRAELISGDGSGVNFFVTTRAPHRLVKVTINSSPLEFQLVKEEKR